jgi:acyl dehydratase
MNNEQTERLRASDVAVGDEGPTLVVENVDRVDFVKYAGASGDFNPLHVIEPYAKKADNPSVFGQGMLTAGYAAQMLTDWFGVGNLDRFKTRFTAKLWPGDTVTVTGEVVDTDESDGNMHVDTEFAARNQDDETLVTGDATAVLPTE